MYLLTVHILLVLISHITSAQAVGQHDKASLISEKDGCACITLYDPICANDDKTYGNSCELNCARNSNTSLLGLCKGECPCCKEPYVNDPIEPQIPSEPLPPTPGWKTLSAISESESQAEQVNLDAPLLESGDIDIDKAGFYNCICPMIYAPVCGTNNVTYGNSCALGCEKRKNPCLTACHGQCPCCPCKASNHPFY